MIENFFVGHRQEDIRIGLAEIQDVFHKKYEQFQFFDNDTNKPFCTQSS